MFSKNNSTYMFPQLVSPNSFHHSRIVDLNGLDLSIHHDVLAGHYLAAANAPEGVDQSVAAGGDPMAGMATKKQAAAKRDRHSKIYTSQGPRDRRVRLSIGIARKFFDLQELLGFDKPSKTLDWLLTESKSAIKDLMLQTKQNDPQNPSSSSSPSEVDSSGNPGNDEIQHSNPGKGKSVPNRLQKPGKDQQQIAAMNQAKESRVKARARARDRTREKMYIKQMNNESSSNPSIVPIQYMNNQLNDFCRISGSTSSSSSSSMKMNPQGILHYPLNFGAATENRKNMKNPSSTSVWGFQQNLANSRDLSPNCSLPFPYNNSTENWDFTSIASSQPPNLYAILDQHRFLNSSTSNN